MLLFCEVAIMDGFVKSHPTRHTGEGRYPGVVPAKAGNRSNTGFPRIAVRARV